MYTLLLSPDRRTVLYLANVRRRRSAEGPGRRKRRTILKRCGGRCTYCGEPLTIRTATLDHIRPKFQGGGNAQDNLVAACIRCNIAKGFRTPEEWLARLQDAVERLKRPVPVKG